MTMIRSIKQIAYHRNGVGGAGFYAVLFTARGESGLFVASVFDRPGHVSVLRVPDLSTSAGVTFAVNSWRGDDYEPELRAAIATNDSQYSDDLPTLCANCEDCGAPILPEYSHCDKCARSAGENDIPANGCCCEGTSDNCPIHRADE